MSKTLFKAINELVLAFPRQSVPPQTVEVYITHLSDLPEPVVLTAIRQAIGSCTFFPSIAELRELAAGQAEGAGDIAESAWIEVQKEAQRVGYNRPPVFHNGKFLERPTPRFSSPLIVEAVESIGWPVICHGDNEDGKIGEQFKWAFKAIAKRQTNQIKRGDLGDTGPALPAANVRAIDRKVS